jgi:cbb3-type cytochrome oxidase subunit 3
MKKILITVLIIFPSVALASQSVQGMLVRALSLINFLIGTVFVLAILVFFYGLVRFVLSAGEKDARERAKQIMVWGVIAVFIMTSIWGIIAFLQDSFGVDVINTIY